MKVFSEAELTAIRERSAAVRTFVSVPTQAEIDRAALVQYVDNLESALRDILAYRAGYENIDLALIRNTATWALMRRETLEARWAQKEQVVA